MNRETVMQKLLKSGALAAFIRQRPFDVVANPAQEPKAIFISCFDSAPLAPDMDFVCATTAMSSKQALMRLASSPGVRCTWGQPGNHGSRVPRCQRCCATHVRWPSPRG
jgi:Na+-transporting NADH:ubiquinone oxidoreductase subunit NqrA